MIDARLRERVTVDKQQFGFMPNRSTIDTIFALRQLTEKYRDGQENLQCVFIDLEKTYDRVPREELWACMREAKITEGHVKAVQDMYKGCRTKVRTPCGETEEYSRDQRLALSFSWSYWLTKDIRREAPWDMLFADDVVICTKTRQEAERRLESWRHALERRGLKVSRKKTEYLCIDGGEKEEGSIRIQGEVVNRVKDFKYLEATVQWSGV
ncbi:uncharacterized protein LOC125032892 [Penaeus chinensis]|uniref:uncharacterized protein LOC125032892 n=1 Tax=Penaeus chinensis TaxID=139456 RepID=UPI001FB59D1C|nr:uncharacterized protein LOC125032892 [Penaeus chinensis]